MQQLLISLSHAAVSHFAPLKTMKGGNFVPSAFAVRQTETRVFFVSSCFYSHSFFYVSDHTCPDGDIIHSYYIGSIV